MAVPYGTRFAANFDQVFPMGALMVGTVAPDMEYLSQEDKARGRQAKQKLDEQTGKRLWGRSWSPTRPPRRNGTPR